MKGGWIKVHRQLQDHWIWTSQEPFDSRSAWMDLLMMASYEDKKTAVNGSLKEIKKGEVYTSLISLSERWKWDRKKVRKFLTLLESDGMITKNGTTQGTTISIVNYSFYQDSGTTEGTTVSPTEGQRLPTSKNIKEYKRNNNITRARGNRFLDFFQRSDDLNAYLAQEVRDG